MNIVAERFIELAAAMQYRSLTLQELREWRESYKYLTMRQWQISKLKEMSYLAYVPGDTEWHHEICAQLEKLERGVKR